MTWLDSRISPGGPGVKRCSGQSEMRSENESVSVRFQDLGWGKTTQVLCLAFVCVCKEESLKSSESGEKVKLLFKRDLGGSAGTGGGQTAIGKDRMSTLYNLGVFQASPSPAFYTPGLAPPRTAPLGSRVGCSPSPPGGPWGTCPGALSSPSCAAELKTKLRLEHLANPVLLGALLRE